MSKTKECFAYNTKIIETPTTKEVYIYENPIFIHSKEKADLTDTSNRKKFDEMSEYSNAIVHAFQRFRAPFSGKIVHIFPEQSAVI